MSRWLHPKPERTKPLEPTAMVRKVTAVAVVVPRLPHSRRKLPERVKAGGESVISRRSKI